jgi:diguanylate cyclase (GGDEF)-like protein/PAS domain S-box-containing protein
MTNIIDLKEFSHFLKVNRNYIITLWLESNEVKNIFSKHSLPIVDKNIVLFHEFCDCFISSLEWEHAIEQCHVKIEFLKILNNYNISTAELFTLVVKLEASIESVIYENGYFSYFLNVELDTVTLKIADELTQMYFQVQDGKIDYKSEQTNLLNEYKRAVDISNIVSKTNPKGIITYVNDKFCEISGYNRNELIGRPHSIIRHPDMERSAFKDLWDTIKSKKPWHGIIKNMRKDGRQYIVDSIVIPILDIDGDVIEYMAVRHDITELEETKEQLKNINQAMKNKVDELHSMTSSLEQQANMDKLTGIFNRDKFEEIFSMLIKDSAKRDRKLSLVLFDIDYFKSVNDTYGHQAGDTVLKELSDMIANNIKTSDFFARWGGEEFVILLPNTDLDGAYLFAEKLRKLVKTHHFDIVGKITVSFGVGELNEYENKLTLFEKVDKALYQAKNKGRNRVEKAMFNCVN